MTLTAKLSATDAISLDEVAQHDKESSCWSAIYDQVYDLTDYALNHPRRGGGADNVYLLCGIEGTSLYDSFHGNHPEWLEEISDIKHLGALSSDPTPSPTKDEHTTASPTTATDASASASTVSPTALTTDTDDVGLEELAQHNTTDDCWICYDDKVFDLSDYEHPAGDGMVKRACGQEDTERFLQVHDLTYLEDIESFFVGNLTLFDTTIFTGAPSSIGTTKTDTPTSKPSTRQLETDWQTMGERETEEIVYVSLNELALHDNEDDCWVSYYEEVYDVTNYAPNHPAGPRWLYRDCGGDGTDNFEAFHPYEYLWDIQRDFIGNLSETEEIVYVSLHELALHDNEDDCWVSYYDEVYDVTDYAPNHPAGPRWLYRDCGGDGTDNFEAFHPYEYLWDIQRDFIGNLTYDSVDDGDDEDDNGQMDDDTDDGFEPTASPTFAGDDRFEPTASPTFAIGQFQTTTTISKQALLTHSSVDDCWVAYYGEVFDVTEYAPDHPGGADFVTNNCGHDDTESYSIFHDYELLDDIREYFKGMLVEESAATAEPTVAPVIAESTESSQQAKPTLPPEPAQQQARPTSPPDIQPAATQTGETQPPTVVSNGMITFSELRLHSTPADCWVEYHGDVYDMTVYAPDHPSGSESVTNDCGAFGTEQFDIFHPASYLNLVKEFKLGPFDMTTISSDADELEETIDSFSEMTMEEVALHNHSGSCYVRYFDEVYDLTYYSHPSPPGQSVIYQGCGQDGTNDFAAAHPRSLLQQVEEFHIGYVEASSGSWILRESITMVLTISTACFLSLVLT